MAWSHWFSVDENCFTDGRIGTRAAWSPWLLVDENCFADGRMGAHAAWSPRFLVDEICSTDGRIVINRVVRGLALDETKEHTCTTLSHQLSSRRIYSTNESAIALQ